MTVVTTDLDEAAALETASLIKQKGGNARAFKLDVTDESSISQLGAFLDDLPVDILINNAGLQFVSPLEDFPQDKWDLVIKVMLNGACLMTRAFLPSMKRNNFGRIVNMGSIHSLVASPFKSAYVTAKHGLMGFSKVIALETAAFDITVNTVCPSYVKTPLVDKQIANQAKAHHISEEDVIKNIMLKPMPKGVFISMEELSGIILFLVSGAARNITGQAITVDGGWTIQ